jgi:phage FluMu protein Com
MSKLVKTCPFCGLLMWPKAEDIEYLDDSTIRVKCPHCQQVTRFSLVTEGSNASGPKMGH